MSVKDLVEHSVDPAAPGSTDETSFTVGAVSTTSRSWWVSALRLAQLVGPPFVAWLVSFVVLRFGGDPRFEVLPFLVFLLNVPLWFILFDIEILLPFDPCVEFRKRGDTLRVAEWWGFRDDEVLHLPCKDIVDVLSTLEAVVLVLGDGRRVPVSARNPTFAKRRLKGLLRPPATDDERRSRPLVFEELSRQLTDALQRGVTKKQGDVPGTVTFSFDGLVVVFEAVETTAGDLATVAASALGPDPATFAAKFGPLADWAAVPRWTPRISLFNDRLTAGSTFRMATATEGWRSQLETEGYGPFVCPGVFAAGTSDALDAAATFCSTSQSLAVRLRMLGVAYPGLHFDVSPRRVRLLWGPMVMGSQLQTILLHVMAGLVRCATSGTTADDDGDVELTLIAPTEQPRCQYCGDVIDDGDRSDCPACATPHHRDCWADGGGCTTYGCSEAPRDAG